MYNQEPPKSGNYNVDHYLTEDCVDVEYVMTADGKINVVGVKFLNQLVV